MVSKESVLVSSDHLLAVEVDGRSYYERVFGRFFLFFVVFILRIFILAFLFGLFFLLIFSR